MSELEKLEREIEEAKNINAALRIVNARLLPYPGRLQRMVQQIKEEIIPEVSSRFESLLHHPDKDGWAGIQAFVDLAKECHLFRT